MHDVWIGIGATASTQTQICEGTDRGACRVPIVGSAIYALGYALSPAVAMGGLWGVTAVHFLHKMATKEHLIFKVCDPARLGVHTCIQLYGLHLAEEFPAFACSNPDSHFIANLHSIGFFRRPSQATDDRLLDHGRRLQCTAHS